MVAFVSWADLGLARFSCLWEYVYNRNRLTPEMYIGMRQGHTTKISRLMQQWALEFTPTLPPHPIFIVGSKGCYFFRFVLLHAMLVASSQSALLGSLLCSHLVLICPMRAWSHSLQPLSKFILAAWIRLAGLIFYLLHELFYPVFNAHRFVTENLHLRDLF